MHFAPFRYRSWRIGSITFAFLLTAALVLSGCGTKSKNSDENVKDATKIVFAVGNKTLDVGTAPYVAVPQAMKYWSQDGLDVQVVPVANAPAQMQLLSAGKADIVLAGTSSFYAMAKQMPDLRIVWLQSGNIWHIVVPEDSPIKSIADLKGKTIGVKSLGASPDLFSRAAVGAAGLDANTDVKWLPVGEGAQTAAAFKSGDIDAYGTYDGPSGVVGNLLGQPMRDLSSAMDDTKGTGGVATTATFLKKHPDAVEKFLRGYDKGVIFCAANPEAALKVQWAAHPDQKPHDASATEALSQYLPIVKSRFEANIVPGEDGVIGDVSRSDVEKSVDFLLKYGVIKDDVDLDKILDLSLVKKASNFDRDSIVKEATDYK